MNQKEKKLRSYYLTEDMIKKLDNVTKLQPVVATFSTLPPRLAIFDSDKFYQNVRTLYGISENTFRKMLKHVGFKKYIRQDRVEYRWRSQTRFNLQREINSLTDTLKSQAVSRKQLLMEMAHTKVTIDQMMEDMIFKMLVDGDKVKDSRHSLQNIVRAVQVAIAGINFKCIQSANNLQLLYEQELKTYKAMISSEDNRHTKDS